MTDLLIDGQIQWEEPWDTRRQSELNTLLATESWKSISLALQNQPGVWGMVFESTHEVRVSELATKLRAGEAPHLLPGIWEVTTRLKKDLRTDGKYSSTRRLYMRFLGASPEEVSHFSSENGRIHGRIAAPFVVAQAG